MLKNIEQIPALAGFADRIDIANPELMEKYMRIAQNSRIYKRTSFRYFFGY